MRLPEVKAKLVLAAVPFMPLRQQGISPSIRIKARAVGWLESDIDQWIETRRIGAVYGRG